MHTLIETNTLNTCTGICAPPPPYTVQHRHMHNTTHNITCQGWAWRGGRGGVIAQHFRGCLCGVCVCPLTPPPPRVAVWVLGLTCLLGLRLGRVSVSFLHVWHFFQNAFSKWLHRGHALTGRCVTPPPPAMCDCGVVQLPASHHPSPPPSSNASLPPSIAPPGYRLCPPTYCVRVAVVCFVPPPPRLWIIPPPPCVHCNLPCWFVGGSFLCWWVGCW